MQSCVTAEEIERLIAGVLSVERRTWVHEHLEACAACRERLQQVQADEQLVGTLRRAEAASSLSGGASGPPFAANSGTGSDLICTVRSPRSTAAGAADSLSPINAIPGYDILREIHRGGQGVVYQAIQKHTRRKVAIKVLKEGPFASKRERARFEREVEILGQLNHPNIVGVHDSGMAGSSFYFVMDYISGQPLDAWMSSGDHSVEEVLRLFAKACEGVNAAHLRGIIHRDLKPANIRIDAEGEPHVLDFGLAKVASGSEASVATVTGQFMGTLAWASPEQAEGIPDKIDIRTDVYSLGVILYQILTGRFPYDVVGNIRDVINRIMHVEPVRPSTVAAALRGGRINDEVETIVLKCLNKERQRRYQSAGELARDIGHYLAGEPIEAKRDSAWYVLCTHLRRYRAAVGVAAAFALLVALASVTSTVLWRQAANSRDQAQLALDAQAREAERASTAEKLAEQRLVQAEKERRKAEAVNQFLTSMFSSAQKREEGRPVTVEEVLDLASKNLEQDRSLAETPELEIALRSTLARTYYMLDLREPARRHYRAALQICRRTTGEESPETLQVRARMALTNPDEPGSEAPCRDTLATARRVLGPQHETTLTLMFALAENLFSAAHSGSAEKRLAEAEAILRDLLAIDPTAASSRYRCMAMYRLAEVLQAQRRLPEAEALRRQAAELDRTGEAAQESGGWFGIAGTLIAHARLEEAEPLVRRAYEVYQRTYGEERSVTGAAVQQLADVLDRQNKHGELEALYTARVRSLRTSPGDQHPVTLEALETLGGFYAGHHRYAEAEPIYRDLREICRELKGDTDESTLRATAGLASALEGQKKLTDAAAVYIQAIQSLQTATGRIGDLLSAEAELARFYRDQARFADAEKAYLQCYEDARRLLGKSDKTAGYLQGLMTLYVAWGQPQRCDLVGADMQRYDVKPRLQLIGDLMLKLPDHLESLFPTCKDLDATQLAQSQYDDWLINLVGRAVAFSGDFDRAVRILRIPAERDRSTNGGWWYIVGWAELLAGRAEQARPPFLQAIQGTNPAATLISRYYLAEVDEQRLTSSYAGLGWFFIGERRLLSADREGARQAYENCIDVKTTDVAPANYARLRLRQLAQNSSALPRPLPPSDRFWEHPQQTATVPASPPAAGL